MSESCGEGDGCEGGQVEKAWGIGDSVKRGEGRVCVRGREEVRDEGV